MRAWVLAAVPAVLVGGLAALPGCNKGGDDGPPRRSRQELAAARMTSSNNLKQIGLAVHNHCDRWDQMPGDILDTAGKPLLSWRVRILPYLEHESLHKQFRLNEPWDSEHNKKLIGQMPKVYTPVVDGTSAKPGETFYQTFTGEGTLFVRHKPQFRQIFAIPDGTSNTIFAVEAGTPVVWTKPEDIPFDRAKPLPKFGGLLEDVPTFNAVLLDGSVRSIKREADEKELKKLIMPADGEVHDDEKL